MSKTLHLDVTGGIAGDMFLAAMLSAFPQFRADMDADLQAAGVMEHLRIEVLGVTEKGFAATRVDVVTASDAPPTSHWRDIRRFLEASALRETVKTRALAIFTHLAEAEATCHGVEVDAVHFHEIADWDSLADIVAAASLIEQSGAKSWSASALPMGSGRVKTRHGLVPVPAPATAELLKGFAMFSDAAEGERITPTGAAILRHLAPTQSALGPRGAIGAIGIGAGRRQLEGVANILRILVLEGEPTAQDQVCEIAFEIDDMTGEELALSLDILRAQSGVLDVMQLQGIGKKGRAISAIRVLAQADAEAAVVDACFSETSTIGLRVQGVARHVLARVQEERFGVPVKTVSRPTGQTRKVESDALVGVEGLAARRALARKSETSDG